jgi:uncharacterized protein YodC (DUF2158 family)
MMNVLAKVKPVDVRPGDVVQLKSGGPLMTVRVVEEKGGIARALCVWFDDAKRCDGAFELVLLQNGTGRAT